MNTAFLQKFNLMLTLLVAITFVFLVGVSSAQAQANPQLNYQGKLTNGSGVAVPDGSYNMKFWLLSSSTAATSTALWSEILTGANRVTVSGGLFSIMLGSSTPFGSLDWDQVLYLGVEIGGTSTPAWDGEMSPRKILGTVPAAFVAQTANYAEDAGTLDGVASTSFLRSDEADTMSATSSSPILSIIQNGVGRVLSLFSGVTEIFSVLSNGNVGIGTTTPDRLLTVSGTALVTGTSTLATTTATNLTLEQPLAATSGGTGLSTITQNQLLIGGAGNTWTQVATGSLGLGNNTFLGLTDTPSSYTANRLLFTNSGASAVTDSSDLVFTGTNFGIGSTTPSARLTIVGAAGTANTLTIASSTGSTTLAMLSNGNLELPGQLISAGIEWIARNAAEANSWRSVTYGNGKFVAVSIDGTNRVMYSSDGINWATSSATEANQWISVTYGNGLFVAISYLGTNRVMTSTDGITWTARSAPEANFWQSITYGNGLFVAVSTSGTNRVMTSTDGITWTARSAAEANAWNGVTYGNGKFVAVAGSGTNRVMYSSDGINWATSSAATVSSWYGVTYGNGLFVAVSTDGALMTSPDGITWTARSIPEANQWASIIYGEGLFVVASWNGTNRIMTSPDGITWTSRYIIPNFIGAVTYGNGLFVAVAADGTNRVMTSGKTELNQVATNNIFQGGTSFMGGLRAGTTSASVASIFLQSQAGINPFAIASSSGTSLLTLTQAGNLGLGTTTPDSLLTVAGNTYIGGNLTLTGGIFDSANATGTLGMVLQSTGTSTRWTATSSLGLPSTFLALSDTPSSYTANRLLFTNSGASAVTDSSDLVFTGTNFGIGSTTPSARLTIQGAAGTANTLTIASSTGSTTLALLSNGNLELPGQLISAGIEWTNRSIPDTSAWQALAYGDGVFVTLSGFGSSPVMYSSDGITWATTSVPESNDWRSITYGNGQFVAVSADGTNRVMTSPDGINWTARSAAEANVWQSVVYGKGIFVAIAISGTNRVMTSPDGINWTARSAAEANYWESVTYGNGVFVAVSQDGTNRVMTSPNGITWTARSAAEANQWRSVTYGNGLFVAVADSGTNRVMTSPDGITWTARSAAEANQWWSITYGNGLFVSVAIGGTNRVMTSPDGITWTARNVFISDWQSISYGNSMFVAIAPSGYIMTSGKTEFNQVATNNIFQGGTSFMGGLRAGTTSASVASIFLQSQAGINPFAIASSSGTSLLTLTQAGNLGLGTTTISDRFTIQGTAGTDNLLSISSSTGSSLLRLQANGNLVIGTSTVTTDGKLSIYSESGGDDILVTTGLGQSADIGLYSANNQSSGIDFREGSSSFGATIIYDGANNRLNLSRVTGGIETPVITILRESDNVGFGSTTPSARLTIQGTAGTDNLLSISSSTGSSLLTLTHTGNLGLGTTTPSSLLTVAGTANITGATTLGSTLTVTGNTTLAGLTSTNATTTNLAISGALRDSTSATGTLGMVLQSTGTSTRWVATSSLGITGGSGTTFLALSDTPSSYTANRLLFTNSGASAVTDSADLVFTGTNFGIGSTTPSARLTIQGTAGTANTLTIASSSGSIELALLSNGDLELPGQLISAGIEWLEWSAAENNDAWYDVAYGNGRFVAVSPDADLVITSVDGTVWATATPSFTGAWRAVTYGNGLFVAVGSGGGDEQVMTSPDGLNWTPASSYPGGSQAWYEVTYGNGLFVAVGDGNDKFIISRDGMVWDSLSVAGNDDLWTDVVYAEELFVAVSYSGGTSVVTSPDGITWTPQTALGDNDGWQSVTYGNGLFVAVGYGPDRIMTSPDGVTWSVSSSPEANDWNGVTYDEGLFVAVSGNGTNQVMTSPDGINWVARISPTDQVLQDIVYGNGRFVAVSSGGSDRIFTSGKLKSYDLVHNNIFQGGTSFMGGLRAGTTTASIASIFLQSQAGINPFTIASSSGTSLLTLTQAGNLGLGTTTPSSLLTVAGNTYIGGNLRLTGGIFDSANATGTLGMVLQSTGTSTRWTSLSTTANRLISNESGSSTIDAVISITQSIIPTADVSEGLAYISELIGNPTSGTTMSGHNLDLYKSASQITGSVSYTGSALNAYRTVTSVGGGTVASVSGALARFLDECTVFSSGVCNSSANVIEVTQSYTGNTGSALNVTTASTNGGFALRVNDDGTLTDSTPFVINSSGNVGIGTTTPSSLLTVAGTANITGATTLGSTLTVTGNTTLAGLTSTNATTTNLAISGALRDSTSATGTLGMVLQSTGTSTRWVATSTLGITGGAATFLALSDTPSSYTANRLLFTNSGASAVTDSADLVFTGTNFGIGSTTPSARLTIQGTAGTDNLLSISSSTGSSLLTLTHTGNLGLGTTSPTALLGMQKSSIAGAAVGGLDQYFTYANGTASAVQYGNRTRLQMSNTATTTMVGNFLTVTDSTTFGNTVRGLEVQADLGGNTQGENTALSGFARTFGVRGITSGDAGGTFEPAGIYGETTGLTQGNAIRGYSSTITTAALLKLFQDSSTFTGTGMLMNFGNSGGSFSSTTASRFIDLRNANTSVFTVGAYGMLTIGDGGTTNNAGLQIGYGGLCVDDDGSCNASTTGRISAEEYHTGNSDLAEMYFGDSDIEPGDIVYLKGGLSIGRASTGTADLIFGVVSTKPGLLLGYNDSSLADGEVGHPVALSGRVPIKLSNENGDIRTGDELMLSSIPGVAMKASSTGKIIGIALEDFDSTRAYSDTFINQFGENIIVPEYLPMNRVNDPRVDDGCYYGGGSATGDAPCVPLKATTTEAQYDEADALAALEAKEEALAELAEIESETVEINEGETVQVGKIVMFVKLENRYLDEDGSALIAALMGVASSTEETAIVRVWERLVTLANNFIDGVLSVFTLKAERVETNELCVDGVCVNANDLRRLLESSSSEDQVVEVIVAPPDEDEEIDETEGGEGSEPVVEEVETGNETSSTTPELINEGGDGGTGSASEENIEEEVITEEGEGEILPDSEEESTEIEDEESTEGVEVPSEDVEEPAI